MSDKVKITFSIDKKLSINYNSIGVSLGAEVPIDDPTKIIEMTNILKSSLEPVVDQMLMDSAKNLPRLAKKAGDAFKADIPY